MTEEDMIKAFLAKNDPKVCPEADYESNGQNRKNNIKGGCTIPKFNARTAKRFICELCGEEDAVAKKNNSGAFKLNGFVNGKYVGDKYCSCCRKRLIDEQKYKSYKRSIYELYGGKESYSKWKEIYDGTTKTEIFEMTKDKATKTLADLIWANGIKSNSVLLKRIEFVEERLSALNSILNEADWEDWDTPLYNFDE